MPSKARIEARRKLRERNATREIDRGGFEFKHLLNLDNYPDAKFFNLEIGDNYIDHLPYIVSSDNHPEGFKPGEDDYVLYVWEHRNVGVNNDKVLCLKKTYGKKCPICEHLQSLLDGGKDWDEKECEPYKPKPRCYYNITDMSEDSETGDEVLIFETSAASKGVNKQYDYLLTTESKKGREGIIAFYDIEVGKTVLCRCGEGVYNKRKFPAPERVDFIDREPYPETIYKEVFPLDALLKVPTYDEVARIFLELDTIPDSNDDVENDESKKEPEPKRRTRRKKTTEKEEVPDDLKDVPSNPCPFDLNFGGDFKSKDECEKCDESSFEACGDEYDRKEIEREKEKTKKGTRRRTRSNKK